MPMMPSVLAVALYAGVKIAGYSTVAASINQKSDRQYPPLKFGFIKIGAGFAGGIAYIVALMAFGGASGWSDASVFFAYAPIRFGIWIVVLGYCYGLFERKRRLLILSAIGVAVSYLLDVAVFGVSGVLPGMKIAFC